MKNIIVYASDGNDFDRLEISAWSVKKYLGEDTELVLLTESHLVPHIRGMKLVTPTNALQEAGIFSNSWGRKHSFAVLYRLVIPLLDDFKDTDRIVYLDTDTLVKSEKAKQILFETDISHCEIAGVPDVQRLQERNKELIEKTITQQYKEVFGDLFEKNNTLNKKYINAGVVVFNLKKIRENGIELYKSKLRAFWFHILSGEFSFQDQDFLNCFMDVSPTLDKRVNQISHEINEKDVVIRHYVHNSKSDQIKDATADGFIPYSIMCKTCVPAQFSMEGKKQLVLFVSHIVNQETIWRFNKLKEDTAQLGIKIVWCFNSGNDNTLKLPENVENMTATNEEVLQMKEVMFLTGNSAIKYSVPTYFLMRAINDYPDYDYIWVMEFDVCYSGNWKTFFERMNKLPHDYLCTRLLSRRKDPRWRWWRQSNTLLGYTFNNSFHALNCIARVSRDMLVKIYNFYKDNAYTDGLFFENAWATVAMNEGSCLDIYYTECHHEFNFSQDCERFLVNPIPNKLYHAIKDNIEWRRVLAKCKT